MGHEQPFEFRHIQTVLADKLRTEHHGDFLVVLRGDPDVAALFIEQIQRVVTAIETERQSTRRRAEVLLDAGVHLFFVDLDTLQIQIADLPGEMARRHLLVMLDPARCGADLFGHIGGVERLNLERIARCHGVTLRTLLVRFGAA